MGCSSSRLDAAPAAVKNNEGLKEMSRRDSPGGMQGERLASPSKTRSASTASTASTSPSKSSWRSKDSNDRSPAKSALDSLAASPTEEFFDNGTMEIAGLELLCETQAGGPSKLRIASTLSEAPTNTETFSELSICSAISCSSKQSDESSFIKFDTLQIEELRHIQVAILSGMLIALAEPNEIRREVGAFPRITNVALMQCQRAIKKHRTRPENLVLTLSDLVCSFKGVLVEAGVERSKVERICKLQLKQVRSSLAGKIFVDDIDVSELVDCAQTSFFMEKWDELGYATGRLAWEVMGAVNPHGIISQR